MESNESISLGAFLATGTPEVSPCVKTQGIRLAGALLGTLMEILDKGIAT